MTNDIKNKIHIIRGAQVMLDSDLAEMYQVKTKNLNLAVKRNIFRFSESFRFQLTQIEFEEYEKVLRLQIETSKELRGGRRYLPFVFTEEGIKILNEIMKNNIDISTLFNRKDAVVLSPLNSDLTSKIHNLRGFQIILDFDLATLYNVETRTLKKAVKRNSERFPNDFLFELNDDEIDLMVSQFVIPSKQKLGGSKPYAFTEQGISNLSSILNSHKAIEINIHIMRAFVSMRKFLTNNAAVFQRLDRVEQKQIENDSKFNQLFDALDDKSIKPKQGVFYDGQVFDAYIFVADLIKSATKSIVLIDNYIDETILQLFTKRKKM